MIYSLLLCLWSYQDAPQTEMEIWEEIAHLEALIKTSVSENDSHFAISSGDSVRGYYIARQGVVILVPVRYRPNVDSMMRDKVSMPNLQETVSLEKRELQKRVRDWQEALRKNELLKEANFEKVVTQLKQRVPEILEKLSHLPEGESLTLIVEERVPAWFFAGFSLKKEPTRKVVTLTVDNDLIAQIHASKTVFPGEVLKRIKRQNTTRPLATAFP